MDYAEFLEQKVGEILNKDSDYIRDKQNLEKAKSFYQEADRIRCSLFSFAVGARLFDNYQKEEMINNRNWARQQLVIFGLKYNGDEAQLSKEKERRFKNKEKIAQLEDEIKSCKLKIEGCQKLIDITNEYEKFFETIENDDVQSIESSVEQHKKNAVLEVLMKNKDDEVIVDFLSSIIRGEKVEGNQYVYIAEKIVKANLSKKVTREQIDSVYENLKDYEIESME